MLVSEAGVDGIYRTTGADVKAEAAQAHLEAQGALGKQNSDVGENAALAPCQRRRRMPCRGAAVATRGAMHGVERVTVHLFEGLLGACKNAGAWVLVVGRRKQRRLHGSLNAQDRLVSALVHWMYTLVQYKGTDMLSLR